MQSRFIYDVRRNGFWHTITVRFYWLAVSIDQLLKVYETYDYETAPYCGHHFNGSKGKFSSSDYHEGMGGASFDFYFLTGNYDDECGYDIALAPFRFLHGAKLFRSSTFDKGLEFRSYWTTNGVWLSASRPRNRFRVWGRGSKWMVIFGVTFRKHTDLYFNGKVISRNI